MHGYRQPPIDRLRLLAQTVVAPADDGGLVPVADLTMLDRARLLRRLRRQARVAWLSSLLRRELGEELPGHCEGETAESWLAHRPLVMALVELNRLPVGAATGWRRCG